MSGEEKCKSLIVSKIWILNLTHVNSVNLGESTVHDVSEGFWDPHGADIACDSRGDSGHRDDVLDRLVFLEGFVNGIKREPSGHNVSKEVLERFLRALGGGPQITILLHQHLSWDGDTESILGNKTRIVDEKSLPDDQFPCRKQNDEKEWCADQGSVFIVSFEIGGFNLELGEVLEDSIRFEWQNSDWHVLYHI